MYCQPHSPISSRRSRLPITLVAALALIATAPTLPAIDGIWVQQGPGPIRNGQVEGLVNGEVIGAIQTVAAHPTDATIAYVGAVNGGIWMTSDAQSAQPSWTKLSDDATSISIGALEFDPTDATNQTLVGGNGRFSSLSRVGGGRFGLLRTTNGGTSFTALDGGGTLTGKNVSGVAARGSTIVISANDADTSTHANYGVFRSADTGASFSQVSVGDGSTTGLPGGKSHDLVGDPSSTTTLYASIINATPVGGVNGIYKSTDTGASWSRVSSASMDAILFDNTSNVEIAVGASDNVYVAIANSGQLAGLFRSANGGTAWVAMDIPSRTVHPGGQASRHMSIAADRTNVNIVYIGGDRQDLNGNTIGASDFSGNLYRCDASQFPGSQCKHLTHSNSLGPSGGGTASTSAPHADSREMVVDAGNEIIETDDGGIYRRTSPLDNTGDWFSMNGDITTTEYHDAAWDSVSQIVIGGAQDTGTSYQLTSEMLPFDSVSTADGGKVAVDELSALPNSIRYSSFQFLSNFRRETWDPNNNFLGRTFPPLTVIGGGAALSRQFYTPIELNALAPTRLIVGGSNSVYESSDQGGTITEIGPGIVVNGTTRAPIAYGAGANADALWVGSGSDVFVRMAAHPAPLTSSATYPGTATVADITLDPTDPTEAFVADSGTVYRTEDSGASWSDITGNLGTLSPGTLRSIEYVDRSAGESIVVGGHGGAFIADGPTFSTWTVVGSGLPTVPVFELEWTSATGLLMAGTLGRGAWTLDLATDIFADGFESGNTSMWSTTVP